MPRHDRLWVVPAGGEEQARCLTAELDATIGNTTLSDLRAAFTGAAPPLWSPDSERLYALVSGPGTAQLYEVRALPGGAPARALTEGEHDLIAFDADAARERFVLLRATATAPPELFTAELRRSEGGGAGGGGDGPVQAGSGAGGPAPQPAAPLELQPLTRVHAGWLAQLELAAPELLEVAGAGGERVQAWLLLPPGAPAGRRHPLVLSVHGGPHAQYGWTFFHEMQWLAARGYAVLYANPRGSTGRGEEFLRAIRGRWGELDYQDLMAVLEHAAARPDVDPARMAVIGGSYGGYMAAWIIGQTDRFRCAIVERAVTNLHSMFGTCDFPFSPDGYWPGNPWSEPDALLAQSPLSHAHRVRTPVLIIHSEGDLRCPIEQAEQYFVALRRNRVEAVLVRYPPESNHGLSRTGPPDLRLDRLERIAAWLARHLGPAAEGAPC
ncbi:MAG: hypothetical protein KatS3mg102_2241 [Planctomycetota bacterium]|nr:MAG: hypothetical protein KatS3mg102_2241 [Planctomycetota bacterium]